MPTGYNDERTRQRATESGPDGAVVLGTPVAPPVIGDMYTYISPENALLQGQRRLSKGVDYLVEASAAEAEAISATLAAVKARQVNGEMEQLPDKEQSPDSTSSSKHSSLMKEEGSAMAYGTPENATAARSDGRGRSMNLRSSGRRMSALHANSTLNDDGTGLITTETSVNSIEKRPRTGCKEQPWMGPRQPRNIGAVQQADAARCSRLF